MHMPLQALGRAEIPIQRHEDVLLVREDGIGEVDRAGLSTAGGKARKDVEKRVGQAYTS